jgi:CO/xanthine dehydrogenase FAD-binding subunit
VDFHWLPASGPQAFLKVCRRGAVSRSVVSVAISLPADGRPRIVIGGCGPRPVRVADAELLAGTGAPGQLLDPELSSAVAEAVRSALSPVDDVAASAAYRRHVAGVLVRRALTLPAERQAA